MADLSIWEIQTSTSTYTDSGKPFRTDRVGGTWEIKTQAFWVQETPSAHGPWLRCPGDQHSGLQGEVAPLKPTCVCALHGLWWHFHKRCFSAQFGQNHRSLGGMEWAEHRGGPLPPDPRDRGRRRIWEPCLASVGWV